MEIIITAIIIYVIAVAFLVISIMQFKEKGLLFNNAYLYADKEQRAKMNKKPYYRQSAIIFLMLALVFVMMGFNCITNLNAFFLIGVAIAIVDAIYAIVSEMIIRQKREMENE